MTCINTVPSTSDTLNNLLLNKIIHYSYIQTEFNDKKETITKISGSYAEPLLKDINLPELLQE